MGGVTHWNRTTWIGGKRLYGICNGSSSIDQHSRCDNIEIVGVALSPNKNINVCLENISRATNVLFKRVEDRSVAHRLRLYSKRHAHPPLIAQFVSCSVKEMWLAAGRKNKAFYASHIHRSPGLCE